jgi:hypothetical protein
MLLYSPDTTAPLTTDHSDTNELSNLFIPTADDWAQVYALAVDASEEILLSVEEQWMSMFANDPKSAH